MMFFLGQSWHLVGGPFRSPRAGLEDNIRRVIDFHRGIRTDEKALRALIRSAAALNASMRTAAHPKPAECAALRPPNSVSPTADDEVTFGLFFPVATGESTAQSGH